MWKALLHMRKGSAYVEAPLDHEESSAHVETPFACEEGLSLCQDPLHKREAQHHEVFG